tara:strand:- start:56 stop:253 length:198 start_codon:yes stop_codon:yes gene_type:complete
MAALALFFAPLVISLAQPSLNCATHAPGFYVLGIASKQWFATYEQAAMNSDAYSVLWYCSEDPME